MTPWTLISRSLRFHARSHLGVLLGAIVGSAVLIGALVVGDSVRGSLRERAMARLGWVDLAMAPNDRFLSLAPHIFWHGGVETTDSRGRRVLQPTSSSTVLMLPGTVSRGDGAARANHVQLIGVRVPGTGLTSGKTDYDFFFGMAPTPSSITIMPGELFLNGALANQLRAQVGDELIFRVHKSSGLSVDAPIAPRSANAAALRLRVKGILSTAQFGDFSLRESAEPALNAFVNLSDLQGATDMTGRVNVLLVPRLITTTQPIQHALQRLLPKSYYHDLVEVLTRNWKIWEKDYRQTWVDEESALRSVQDGFDRAFQLSDAELELHLLNNDNMVELKSRRIFLDPPVVRAGLMAATNAQPVLTYLVNLLRAETNTTPYSMVTAAGPPWAPADLSDDEIVINQWLADDLQVKAGDPVELAYFQPESGAKLLEATNRFRIHSIVPMELPWADRTLMPDFPGIEKAESTHDWDAGFPLVHKIRSKDEDYWKKYRGTPKAFVTLAAGQKMWGNRFGNLTAIRFPVQTNLVSTSILKDRNTRDTSVEPKETAKLNQKSVSNPPAGTPPSPPTYRERYGLPSRFMTDRPGIQSSEEYHMHIEANILAVLKPEELGLRFEPVRAEALKAAEQSQDFGQLFLGFSFFLIVAALLLMAMLFQFGLEQRAVEIGTLLALGFPLTQVRRLLLWEGSALALLGALIGILGGIGYASAMLYGLTTLWRDAVGTSALHLHISPLTLAIGAFSSVVVSASAIWFALRKQAQRPARELLEDGTTEDHEMQVAHAESQRRGRGIWIAICAGVGALLLVGWAIWREEAAAGAFFGAGTLLLIAGMALTSVLLVRLGKSKAAQRLSVSAMGLRGCTRRRKRSLATVALLACGSFLVIAVGANKLDSLKNAGQRSSGTGGFALIGESTLPVAHDLNSREGREFFGLDEKALAGVGFVPFRVHDGDEASCLNLNRAQRPRLLGVKPEMLTERFTFAKGTGWEQLKSETRNPQSELEIPVIGDANSIQWAMGKKVGDTIDYVDERGQPFNVRIVGAVANSILQGSLIIDEAEFVKRFPGEAGYRMFLIDAPKDRAAEISAALSRALQDVGLELQPTVQKLATFNAVQNTYLSTFQILGGLGLLLGSVGLGVVVLRNVLERRGELALLLAVGFRARTLRWLVLSEHGALLWWGLAIGVIAAIIAVLPALLSPGAKIPYLSLTATLFAVLINGLVWTWLAARFALRGRLLDALRNE